MPSPLQRLRCQYDGDFYLMDLSRDRFVHFTTRHRAAEIMESGRLLMRPPYKKFGIDATAAVSMVWGSFLPGVQTTHIDADKSDLVGVVFQTKVMPEVGYPEEVLWKQDVVLVNPKVVPYAKAKGMIRGSSDFDGQVYYTVPSWCDGVEGRVASLSGFMKEAIEESMANLSYRLRKEVDDFAAGVIMGQAPSLEQHTSALYKAFAPLRKALGGTTTMYRGQPINPPKIDRKWLSWTTEPRMAARFTDISGDQIIEAKVKSSDVVAGILSPRNPNYIEFLVKNRPEYQTRSQKQVPIYYALYMPLNPRFYDDMPENFSGLSDREQLEFNYPDWKRWLKDNERAVERAGGKVMHSAPPKYDDRAPFLGVLMPADAELPPALAALDDAEYGRPMPRYMGKVASAARVASRYAATTPLPPSFPKTEIGLMTMDEFLEYRNPQGKFHETETWDYDVMKMNRPKESRLGEAMGYTFDQMRGGIKVTEKDSHSAGVPTLAGVIHNGTLYYSNAREGRNIPDFYFGIRADKKGEIEIRGREQVKYLSEVLPSISPVAKWNVQEHPNIIQRLIVKGEQMTLRSKDGGRGYAPTLVILNSEDLVVAQASDEWGATLIAVAREYRGRGLGKIIGKRWYELNPSNTSGGFTSAGEANALALWRDRVREFKARGWYSEMIREGRITMDRLREIFSGVKDSKRDLEEFKALYFSDERKPDPTEPTGDILVWSDGDTGAIVYDRAFLEDPDDRFIHGYGILRHTPQTGTYIFSIEYDRPYAEMTTKALMQAARDGGDDRLYDGDGYSDIVEAENISGVERDGDYLVLTRDLFPLRQEARKEKRIRKSVDPYDEKFYLLQEQADSKWR